MTEERTETTLPASALQHYLFCPTQFALIHIQNEWEDDLNTQIGRTLHEGFHQSRTARRSRQVQQSGILLFDHRYNLSCQPDRIDWSNGVPVPVEAKKGGKKKSLMDAVQLQVAGLCLESLTGRTVAYGRLFYWGTRTSEIVEFTSELKEVTFNTIKECRTLIETKTTPTGFKKPCCRKCSLKYICLPR